MNESIGTEIFHEGRQIDSKLRYVNQVNTKYYKK